MYILAQLIHLFRIDCCLFERVVVPSKWQLSLLRQEVDAMRRLRGNKHIVSYIDSHASV